jgi:gluconolactonase
MTPTRSALRPRVFGTRYVPLAIALAGLALASACADDPDTTGGDDAEQSEDASKPKPRDSGADVVNARDTGTGKPPASALDAASGAGPARDANTPSGSGKLDAATAAKDTGAALPDSAAPSSGATKGASGAAVCPPGASYGSPLANVGAVIKLDKPTGSNGYSFTEGPVWVDGSLYFSDHTGARQIYQLTPPAKSPKIWKDGSGSNGLAIDQDDKLVVADESKKRLLRVDPKSGDELGVIASGSWTPNDLVVRSDGTIYFTDPSSGVYRVAKGASSASKLELMVPSPNGVVLSPDEKTLYVANVNGKQIYAFSVSDAGDVSKAAGDSVFVNVSASVPDGMAVDCAGNLYVGTDKGVEVFAPDGAPVGTIASDYSSNCTFGGADRKTLYITSRGELKAVQLAVPGLPD